MSAKPAVYEQLFDECLADDIIDLEDRIRSYLDKLSEEKVAREIKTYSEKLSLMKSIF